MNNPLASFSELKSSVLRYIKTAFGTASDSFEFDRERLLTEKGGIFQEPFIEPLVPYRSSTQLSSIDEKALPGLNADGRKAFKDLCSAALFPGTHRLFTHQEEMLEQSLAGHHCVVTTGTGSGKTEAFLLPLIASIIREASTWPATEIVGNPTLKWEQGHFKWNFDKRKECWGEQRDAALRGLILYPMNALVEDQLSRLRDALDSDPAHKAYSESNGYFKGNRITFSRFNSETPVSGHPFKEDGKPNASARSRLKKILEDMQATHISLSKLQADAATDEERENADELFSFFPRVDSESTEMLHRWEMQRRPPDILITNFSMLSVMLMRAKDPAIPGDQGDRDIIEATRLWLENDPWRKGDGKAPVRIFHLVIDELHLYRGTAGTEVAYLIRLLLHRLGLEPQSPQLRILASSASLELSADKAESTFEFLGQFFGFSHADAKSRFRVIGANKISRMLPWGP